MWTLILLYIELIKGRRWEADGKDSKETTQFESKDRCFAYR